MALPSPALSVPATFRQRGSPAERTISITPTCGIHLTGPRQPLRPVAPVPKARAACRSAQSAAGRGRIKAPARSAEPDGDHRVGAVPGLHHRGPGGVGARVACAAARTDDGVVALRPRLRRRRRRGRPPRPSRRRDLARVGGARVLLRRERPGARRARPRRHPRARGRRSYRFRCTGAHELVKEFALERIS